MRQSSVALGLLSTTTSEEYRLDVFRKLSPPDQWRLILTMPKQWGAAIAFATPYNPETR